ncbi:MAG: hypothetical protein ACRENX_03010 [Candidatus Dormibacteria bacterium]
MAAVTDQRRGRITCGAIQVAVTKSTWRVLQEVGDDRDPLPGHPRLDQLGATLRPDHQADQAQDRQLLQEQVGIEARDGRSSTPQLSRWSPRTSMVPQGQNGLASDSLGRGIPTASPQPGMGKLGTNPSVKIRHGIGKIYGRLDH